MRAQLNRKIPYYTLALSVLTLGLSLAFLLIARNAEPDAALYSKFGAPSAYEIYNGQFWGVFWNSFLHNRWDLLAINLVGLFYLGSFIERRVKFYVLFFLGLLASITTSTVQLSLTDDAGIGLTGVNYFLFFFIFTAGIKLKRYALKRSKLIAGLLIFVLLICVVMNSFENWTIGVESMTAGVVLGSIMGIASWKMSKTVSISIGTISFLVTGLSVFYAPWSPEWNVQKGISFHKTGDFDNAKTYYIEAISINPDNINATENLMLINVDELSEKAYRSHSQGNYVQARYYYEEIIKLDPGNNWALKQVKKLP